MDQPALDAARKRREPVKFVISARRRPAKRQRSASGSAVARSAGPAPVKVASAAPPAGGATAQPPSSQSASQKQQVEPTPVPVGPMGVPIFPPRALWMFVRRSGFQATQRELERLLVHQRAPAEANRTGSDEADILRMQQVKEFAAHRSITLPPQVLRVRNMAVDLARVQVSLTILMYPEM
jgi:hypothetical protein